MPGRPTPLVTNEIYHVFNRGIDHRPTFTDRRTFIRALKVINLYRFASPSISLSSFLRLSRQRRDDILNNLQNKSETLVEFISYCLMPNHFHFLLKQNRKNGIAKFMSNFQNSYTRYFNIRQNRIGPLFLDQFKAVRLQTDEQLLHVSRYIHLNPYSSFIVKKLDEIELYSWSSFPEYLGKKKRFCNLDLILSFFKRKKDYARFVFDQADYQRHLEAIKHLILEDPQIQGKFSNTR